MKCPGQDSRYWKTDAITEAKCPQCGEAVEFFKDDTARRCKGCGHRFLNPAMDFGCASYCKYAEQCIGNLPPELLAQKEDLLKDRVAIEMKRYFKQDFKRIGHAARVARYAEQIGKEMSANLAVILPAAYLHDIGIKEAEEKHPNGSSAHHEKEGPPIAKEILEGLGAHEELINDVCGIIGHHHHPKPKETREYQAVYDADLIANLEDDQKDNRLHRDRIEKAMAQSFLTKEGRDLAKKVLLG